MTLFSFCKGYSCDGGNGDDDDEGNEHDVEGRTGQRTSYVAVKSDADATVVVVGFHGDFSGAAGSMSVRQSCTATREARWRGTVVRHNIEAR